jgi:tetratricopeptide (TPR) repeat protein
MLRPQFQQKLRLALLMLASALIIIAEPAFARRTNENRDRSNQASSGGGNTQQSAPAPAPTPQTAPAPAPVPANPAPRAVSNPAPVIRAPEPVRSVQQPSVSVQSRNITSPPSISMPQQSVTTQNRVITNNPSQSLQQRNGIINQQPVKSQVQPNTSVSQNRSISTRTDITSRQDNIPSISNQQIISTERENSIGFSIGQDNRNSASNSSSRSNSLKNREQTRTITNESIFQNNSKSNRSTNSIYSNRGFQLDPSVNNRISSELSSQIGDTLGTKSESATNIRSKETNSSRNRIDLPFDKPKENSSQIETRQPAASQNNRISTELKSRIGDTIGTQPESTTTVRNQETKDSRNRVILPFDKQSGSQRTTPPAEIQQPAVSSNTRSSIFENILKPERVTPPLNSERQPVERSRSKSSIDRANTDVGIMNGPERTPPEDAKQPAARPNNRDRDNRDKTSIGNTIGEQDNSQTRMSRQDSGRNVGRTDSDAVGQISKRENVTKPDELIGSSRENTRSTVGDTSGRNDRRSDRPQSREDTNTRTSPDRLDQTRTSRLNPGEQRDNTVDTRASDSGRRNLRAYRYEPVPSPQIIYRDRPYDRESRYHQHYEFVDRYDHLYRRSITPSFRIYIGYDYGSLFSVRYIYPYYHRKYVFVSLGGYWPLDYSYMRYYWYGYHPYYWYGYDPIARQVGTDVNYYYTYNYYYDDSPNYNTGRYSDSQYYENMSTQPALQPAEATLADTYFEEAVDAFADGKYDLSIEKFSRALELAPNDMILPFAYSQALFAAGRYTEAAEVLRKALRKVKPDKEGVFYPRGLYPDDNLLLAQLDKLADEAEAFSFDADLQLLLGYQLLGINELDKALTPLKNASLDMKNQEAATVLLNLLSKVKVNEQDLEVPPEPNQEKPEQITPASKEIINSESEPDISIVNETSTKHLDVQNIAFLDSGTASLELKAPDKTIENAAANEPAHTKAKEGILIAALFVIAGSTGIGHLMHH